MNFKTLKTALVFGALATACKIPGGQNDNPAPAATVPAQQAPAAVPAAPEQAPAQAAPAVPATPATPAVDLTIMSVGERCGTINKFSRKLSMAVLEQDKKNGTKLAEQTWNWEGEITMPDNKIHAFSLPKGADEGKGNLKDKIQKMMHNHRTLCVQYNQVVAHDEMLSRTDYFATNVIDTTPAPAQPRVIFVPTPAATK